MNAAFSPGSAGRLALGSGLLFLLTALVGCDSTGAYPGDLRYPPRTDVLVIKPPKPEETDPIPPGKLDEVVGKINGFGGGEALDPKKLKESARKELAKALESAFGKPAAPSVKVGDSSDNADTVKENVAALDLDDKAGGALEAGGKLYRRQCLQCHGVTGDGRGPTGPWVSPPPRDYRQGLFKFVSTSTPKPSRADLERTLHNGLEGTSMPSFSMLKEEELHQLVSYVIHLSIRGQTEFDTLKVLLEDGSLEGDSIAGQVEASLAKRLGEWAKASDAKSRINPDTEPSYKNDDKLRLEAVKRGYDLFIDPKGKAICMSCHTDFGRQAVYKYDDWGTLVRPMNLTTGVYRGGRRPIDHFWRIRAGVKPIMSANAKPSAPTDPGMTEEQVWDVVAFIQALPYPAMLPPALREKIYGKPPVGSEVAGR